MKNEMNERNDAALTPAEEDPVVHRHVTAMAAFTPATLLAERVLSQVRMPEPLWARNARAVWNDWTESGRIWLVFGALALGSLIPTAVAATLVASFASEIADGTRWLFDVGLATAVAATASEFATRWTQLTSDGPMRLTAPQVVGMGVGLGVILAGCGWGLRTAMRPGGVR